jgi:hypothetical protein
MATQRTNADRRREFDERVEKIWDAFLRQLAALQTFQEAELLVARAPRPDAPGRKFYSNFGYFLYHDFSLPAGADGTERGYYAAFIRRLDAAGTLKPGHAEGILKAIETPGTFVVL